MQLVPNEKQRDLFGRAENSSIFFSLFVWPLIDDKYGALFPDEPKRVQVINPGNGMLDPSRPRRRVRDIERFTFLNTQHGTSVYK